ncbi:MAG TPA: reverse transcriptase/maturase family protein [bacterium]|nr:reverse transcriptase/maturase family protein [bacterium]HQK41918.1 reverse transcriptase/maturase family protein [bacterium]
MSNLSLNEVLQAYISCRKNKRNTVNQIKFELSMENNLYNLYTELRNRTYLPGRSICFVVTYPKLREIFAADFKDRVVHHLLVSRLELYYEKRFIYDSYACRKNKGAHKAVSRLRKFSRQNEYYLQIDVKNFFTSIDKNILYSIFLKGKFNEETVSLLKKIIFHDPTSNYYLKGDRNLFRKIPPSKSLFYTPKNKGLPIGNLTSQFFANVYLNEVDQYIKRTLKVKHYIRYVDDMILLSDDKKQLLKWRNEINGFLTEKLKLSLHPGKDRIGAVENGIDFLGYIVRPNYILSRRRVAGNLKKKLNLFNKGYYLLSNNQKQISLPLSSNPTDEEIARMLTTVNSYYGHFKHADTYNLRKNLYENRMGKLKNYLEPVDNYAHFRIAK